MRLATVVGVLAACAIGQVARAASPPKHDPADEAKVAAREEFDHGAELYRHGNYENALEYFQRAYAHFADPVFLYNIAQSQMRLGERKQAIRYFELYLSQSPNAKNRDDTQSLLDELKAEELRAHPPKPEPVKPKVVVHVAPPPPPTPSWKKWWFWTVIVLAAGAVAAGVAVAVVLETLPTFNPTLPPFGPGALLLRF
jgi:tetratricopeptide (TPR) repeat protein